VLVRNLMNCWRVSSALAIVGPLNKDLLNDNIVEDFLCVA